MVNRRCSPVMIRHALCLGALITLILTTSGASPWTGQGGIPDLAPKHSGESPSVVAPYTEYVYNKVDVPSGATGATVATCPDDSVLVGGGYSADHDVIFYTQYKYGNGWRGDAVNNAAVVKEITGYAVCLHNIPGASVTQTHGQVSVDSGKKGQALTACPAGSISTGGGFYAYGDGSLRVYNSSRSDSGEGWQSWVFNNSSSSKVHHAYGVCLSGSAGTMSRVLKTVIAPPSETAYADPKCSINSILTSGGFAAQSDLSIFTNSGPHSDDAWRVDAKNIHPSMDRTVFGYAFCLSHPDLPVYDEFCYLPMLANAALP